MKWRVELYIKASYNNEWVDGLSFRSKLDLLQRHKQVRKNTFLIYRQRGNGLREGSIKRGHGLREGSIKKREHYSQSKFLFEKTTGPKNHLALKRSLV